MNVFLATDPIILFPAIRSKSWNVGECHHAAIDEGGSEDNCTVA